MTTLNIAALIFVTMYTAKTLVEIVSIIRTHKAAIDATHRIEKNTNEWMRQLENSLNPEYAFEQKPRSARGN